MYSYHGYCMQMYMSSTKNDAGVGGSNYKENIKLLSNLGENASTIITTCIIAYVAISITDKHLSYLSGSIQEKERLEKERLEKEKQLEKNRMLGWAEGLWTYVFPKNRSQD